MAQQLIDKSLLEKHLNKVLLQYFEKVDIVIADRNKVIKERLIELEHKLDYYTTIGRRETEMEIEKKNSSLNLNLQISEVAHIDIPPRSTRFNSLKKLHTPIVSYNSYGKDFDSPFVSFPEIGISSGLEESPSMPFDGSHIPPMLYETDSYDTEYKEQLPESAFKHSKFIDRGQFELIDRGHPEFIDRSDFEFISNGDSELIDRGHSEFVDREHSGFFTKEYKARKPSICNDYGFSELPFGTVIVEPKSPFQPVKTRTPLSYPQKVRSLAMLESEKLSSTKYFPQTNTWMNSMQVPKENNINQAVLFDISQINHTISKNSKASEDINKTLRCLSNDKMEPFNFENISLNTLVKKCRSRGKLALKLLPILYKPEEMVGRNVDGNVGKNAMEKTRLEFLKKICFYYFPAENGNEQICWRRLRDQINGKIRRIQIKIKLEKKL